MQDLGQLTKIKLPKAYTGTRVIKMWTLKPINRKIRPKISPDFKFYYSPPMGVKFYCYYMPTATTNREYMRYVLKNIKHGEISVAGKVPKPPPVEIPPVTREKLLAESKGAVRYEPVTLREEAPAPKKAMAIIVPLGIAGALGYFAYQKLGKKKASRRRKRRY